MNGVPFDPNGMVMDFLRSCYTSRIAYQQGNSLVQSDATWYFAAPGALCFPGPHAFGSPTWDTVHPTLTDLGWQAQAPRRYYNGRRLNSSDGTQFAGPESYFLVGSPVGATLDRTANGTPLECVPPPYGLVLGGQGFPVLRGRGGLRLGGEESLLVPGVPCAACPGFTPLTVTVTIGGFAVPYTSYNGTWTLNQTASPCVWHLVVIGTQVLTLTRSAGNVWTLTLSGSPTIAEYSGVIPDCVTAGTLAKVFSFFGGNATASLSVP